MFLVSVTEFSKKTGDYPSLSATDIKVLALTYQLELEHVGSQHLKKEPEVKVQMLLSLLSETTCKSEWFEVVQGTRYSKEPLVTDPYRPS